MTTFNDLEIIIDRADTLVTDFQTLIDSERPATYTPFPYEVGVFYLEKLSVLFTEILREWVVEQIRAKVGEEFDDSGVNFTRLVAIDAALASYTYADLDGMLTLVPTYPEIEEPLRQRKLDATFTALRDALHATPSGDLTTETTNYRTAITQAFGVTFEVESGADTWSLVALHFARLGLEATARAFERWADGEAEAAVNRFALFRRLMGSIEFRNVSGTPETYPAENKLDGTGRYIAVYRRSATENWYMSPNNVVHELGHWFDNNSGYLYNKIGSLEYDVSQNSDFSRSGMAEGRAYLGSDSYYIHGSVIDNSGEPEFQSEIAPEDTDPEYDEFVPNRYLFFDVAGYELSVWQSPVYSTRYMNQTRIDTLVQNITATALETAADAFLNWVRDQEYLREFTSIRARRPFYDSSAETEAEGNEGSSWVAFFSAARLGMFMRNAVIFNYPGGMVQFYKDQGVIPQTPIATGTVDLSRQLRLTPSEESANNAINKLSDTPNTLPNPVEVFGWYPPPEPETTLSDLSPRWLLVVDTQNRLLWVASNAIDVGATDVEIYPQANNNVLSPERPYTESDLQILIGS